MEKFPELNIRASLEGVADTGDVVCLYGLVSCSSVLMS